MGRPEMAAAIAAFATWSAASEARASQFEVEKPAEVQKETILGDRLKNLELSLKRSHLPNEAVLEQRGHHTGLVKALTVELGINHHLETSLALGPEAIFFGHKYDVHAAVDALIRLSPGPNINGAFGVGVFASLERHIGDRLRLGAAVTGEVLYGTEGIRYGIGGGPVVRLPLLPSLLEGKVTAGLLVAAMAEAESRKEQSNQEASNQDTSHGRITWSPGATVTLQFGFH